jgi:hypothetical protein
MSIEDDAKLQIIHEAMMCFPTPTEEQYEAAHTEVKAKCDCQVPELAIRMAARSSIDRYTGKFDSDRFWDCLPDYLSRMP